MQTNTNQIKANQIKATPHQQAIKAGANPDVIADRVVQMIFSLENDSWIDIQEITEGCTAIQTAIVTAIARRIDQAGLYPETAIYYDGEGRGRDLSGITSEDMDATPDFLAMVRDVIAGG